jgi:hypothetical protein
LCPSRAGGQAVGQVCWAPLPGRWAAVCRLVQAARQGQRCGMCRVRRLALRASRAGTLIRCARMVAVVARAWKVPARVPTARVRLCAIAQRTAQAALALKTPDGRCARAEAAASAMTCSTMAWSRCCPSACSISKEEVTNTA